MFPLNDLIREEILFLEPTVRGRAQFELELDPQLRSVRGDRDAFKNVVMNLCVNAVDAMESGTIRIRTRNVDPSIVEVEVVDNGSGMPAEVLARAIEPFFTTKFTGQGLGLAAVQGIIRSHEGAIEVVTSEGRGSTFRIFLPTQHATAFTPVTSASPASGEGGRGLVLVAVGVAVGLACALSVTHLLTNLLFTVSPVDPMTFIGVPVILGVMALAASYVPAFRATRIDPAIALRGD